MQDQPLDYFLDALFDPSKATVVELIQILSSCDVELPSSRMKKDFYVNSFVEMIQRKAAKKTKSRRRKQIEDDEPLKATKKGEQVSDENVEKKRASQETNLPYFSQDNIFKTPVKRRKSLSAQALGSLKNVSEVGSSFGQSNRQPAQPLTVGDIKFTSQAPEFTDNAFKTPLPRKRTPPRAKTQSKTPKQTPSRYINLDALSSQVTYTNQTPTSVPPPQCSQDTHSQLKEDSGPESEIEESSPQQIETTRRLKAQPTFVIDWTFLVALVTIVLASLLAHWYAINVQSLSYCDAAQEPSVFESWNPLSFVLPTCLNCPADAVCARQLVLSCNNNKIFHQNKLQRIVPSKFLPFPLNNPTCVENRAQKLQESKQRRRLAYLAILVDDIIRDWTGELECRLLPSQSSHEHLLKNGRAIGMPASLIKDSLVHKLQRKWLLERYNSSWDQFMDAISREDSNEPIQYILHNGVRVLISPNPPHYPLSCRIQKSLFNTLLEYSAPLATILAVFLSIAFLLTRRQTSLRTARITAILVNDVKSMIQDQTELVQKDSSLVNGLAVSHLRDYLLPETLSCGTTLVQATECAVDKAGRTRWLVDIKTKARLWKGVGRIVLRDSNFRETMMEVRGDQYIVWQNVGVNI